MTQEEKQLLAKDIFGRVLTGLKVDYRGQTFTLGYNLYLEDGNLAFESYPMKFYLEGIETIKPYLRPMSSMTEEEKEEASEAIEIELKALEGPDGFTVENAASSAFMIDFYNKHHLDYRGLIPMGLALEAPENMYKQME